MINNIPHKLENSINYTFRNKQFLTDALTHPSYQSSQFEILEFYGDKVLALAITCIVKHKCTTEKELSEQVMLYVNKHTLLKLARFWQLNIFMQYTSYSDTILIDGCEAIIGACFLDSNFDRAKQFIEYNFNQININTNLECIDSKSKVQNWCHKHNKKLVYTIIETTGPAHSPIYKIALIIDGINPIYACGLSKKEASNNAAKKFLQKIYI